MTHVGGRVHLAEMQRINKLGSRREIPERKLSHKGSEAESLACGKGPASSQQRDISSRGDFEVGLSVASWLVNLHYVALPHHSTSPFLVFFSFFSALMLWLRGEAVAECWQEWLRAS